MIKNILFPVDFSPSCVEMAAYVKRAAEIFRAQVTLVHVCDLASHDGFELYARPASEIAQDHRDLALGKLRVFLHSEFPGGSSPRVLLAGPAADGIADTAKKNNVDLIVIPTHTGSFRRMLLGSTTARVLDVAECPVLTAQHAANFAPRPLNHRIWICAIGLSADSERVLRYAYLASLAAGAKLSVIHVVPSPKTESCTQTASEQQICPDTGVLARLNDLTYALVRDSPCPVVSV